MLQPYCEHAGVEMPGRYCSCDGALLRASVPTRQDCLPRHSSYRMQGFKFCPDCGRNLTANTSFFGEVPDGGFGT